MKFASIFIAFLTTSLAMVTAAPVEPSSTGGRPHPMSRQGGTRNLHGGSASGNSRHSSSSTLHEEEEDDHTHQQHRYSSGHSRADTAVNGRDE